MSPWEHAQMIATAPVAAALRELSRRLDKSECDGMFISPVALKATPTVLAGYINNGPMPSAYVNAVTSPTRLYTLGKKAWEDDGDVFPYTQAQITNNLSKCSYSDGTYLGQPEDAFAWMDRLGYCLLQATLP